MKWNPEDRQSMERYRAKVVAKLERISAAMPGAQADVDARQAEYDGSWQKCLDIRGDLWPHELDPATKREYDAALLERRVLDAKLTAVKDRRHGLKLELSQCHSYLSELEENLRHLETNDAAFERLLAGPQEPKATPVAVVKAAVKTFFDGSTRSPERQAAMDAYNEERQKHTRRGYGL